MITTSWEYAPLQLFHEHRIRSAIPLHGIRELDTAVDAAVLGQLPCIGVSAWRWLTTGRDSLTAAHPGLQRFVRILQRSPARCSTATYGADPIV